MLKILELSNYETMESVELAKGSTALLHYKTKDKKKLIFKETKFSMIIEEERTLSDDSSYKKDSRVYMLETLPSGCVMFFNKENFTGKMFRLCDSSSDLTEEEGNSFPNDINSVYIGKGMKIVIYDKYDYQSSSGMKPLIIKNTKKSNQLINILLQWEITLEK